MRVASTPLDSLGEPYLARVDPAIGISEQCASDIVALAATYCETPFATLALPGVDIKWSSLGRPTNPAFPDDQPFDDYVVKQSASLEVPDAGKDERFSATRRVVAG